MGVSNDPQAKANGDFAKRRKEPGEGIEPSETVFVFVTPRRWAKKDAWARRRKEEELWKDVVVYDADDLETWLERALGVHIWISGILGKDISEAESLESWWQSWSQETEPALPTSLFLGGRDDQIQELRRKFRSEPENFALVGESTDEILAFLAAAITTEAQREYRGDVERTLLVRTPKAWSRLAASEHSLNLIPLFDKPNVAQASRHRHRVVIPVVGQGSYRKGIELPRLRREGIEESLTETGIPEDRASRLATIGRRGLLSLRRSLAVNPELQTPSWAQPENIRDIVPTLLAGQWEGGSAGDQEILAKLAGCAYDEYIQRLTRWIHRSDSPVRRIGDRWSLVSKEDSWRLSARFLALADLNLFQSVSLKVLEASDPTLDLPANQRSFAAVYEIHPPFSDQLKASLADTLALMAAFSGEIPLPNRRTGQGVASSIVRELMDKAREDSSGRRWIELSSVLPSLAEAAPHEFLTAVETSLKSENSEILHMFEDGEGYDSFIGSSAHTGLLWALERIAWSPRYLGRSALVLAKLTRLDPGGRLGNRPQGSLLSALKLTLLGTSASLEQRLKVVDLIRKKETDISWRLMISLIPKNGASFPSQAPEWHEWKPKDRMAKRSEMEEGIEGLVDRLLEDAGASGQRWANLIEGSDSNYVVHNRRSEIAARLVERNDELTDQERSTVLDAIRRIQNWSRRNKSPESRETQVRSEVSNSDDEVLSQLVEALQPHSPEDRHAWLFLDEALDNFLDEALDFKSADARLDEARCHALQEILAERGLVRLLEWAEEIMEGRAHESCTIGWTLGKLSLTESDEEHVFRLLISDSVVFQLVAQSYSRSRYQLQGDEARDWAELVLESHAWSVEHQSEFLAALPASPPIWDLAGSRGYATDREYWHRFVYAGLPERGEACVRATRKLLEHQRPHTAVDLIATYKEHFPAPGPDPELVAEALRRAAATPIAEALSQSFGHRLKSLFKVLDQAEFDEKGLTELEWLFLPIFRHEGVPAALGRRLGRDPAFFVDLVSLVYKGEDKEEVSESSEQVSDQSEENKRQIENAYRLLSAWKKAPGAQEDGSIDESTLTSWIHEARSLLAQRGRGKIGDLSIGKILRYVPSGPDELDEIWPPVLVRNVLEDLESDHLEQGLIVEINNSRGVTTRRLTEGGDLERELAEKYQVFAEELRVEWPRTANMLERIAQGYEHYATVHDIQAEQTEDDWN